MAEGLAVAQMAAKDQPVEKAYKYTMPPITPENVDVYYKSVVTDKDAFLKQLPALVAQNLASGDLSNENSTVLTASKAKVRKGRDASLPHLPSRGEEAYMANSAGVGRLRPDGQPEPPAGPNDRRAAILEMVMAAGSVQIEDLPDAFGVSLMTVHRDLDSLATQGLIRKTRGVATAMPSTLSESSTEYRARQNVADKQAVANAALQMIEPGSQSSWTTPPPG